MIFDKKDEGLSPEFWANPHAWTFDWEKDEIEEIPEYSLEWEFDCS